MAVGLALCMTTDPGSPSPLPSATDRAQADSTLVVTLRGDWEPRFAREVLAELEAQFARNGIRIVVEPTDTPPAILELEPIDGDQVSIAVSVRDEFANHDLERSVDLSAMSSDARSLGLAIAAVELLQAGWAELAFTRQNAAKPAVNEPPPTAANDVEPGDATPPASRPKVRHDVVLVGIARGSSTNLTFVGGGVEYDPWPWAKVGFGLGIGASALLPIDTPHGQVNGSAITMTVALIAAAVATPRFRLDIALGVHPGVLLLRGRADTGFTGARSTNFMMDATVGMRPTLLTRRVAVGLFAEVGGVLGTVSVRDAGATVARYAALVWATGLTMSVLLGRRSPP